MTAPRFSRRTFFTGAGLAAVAAACSSDGEGNVSAGDGSTSTTGQQPIAGSLASNDLYVGEEQRFALGVLRQPTGDQGYELVTGDDVLISFTPPGGSATAPKRARFHGTGLPPDRGVYVTRAGFERPGFWEATILVGGEQGTLPFEVRAEPLAPTPSQPAIPVTTPTTEENAGVDPICTRTPQCPFHEVSLDESLEGDLPVVLMFSTPAYCVSRVCGPVLDLLIDQSEEFDGQARFIHVEVWSDRNTTEPSPGMQRWGLQTEPWLFGIDAEGSVVARLEGAFDQSEIRDVILAAVGEDPAEATNPTSTTALETEGAE